MKKIAQYFDYLFYCTYHFMMKIRKTKDRVDDVTWIFSGVFSFPLFGFIFQLWGYLFEKGVIDVRPDLTYLGVFALVLAFGSIYFTDKYFTKKDRYKKILVQYGKNPTKKNLITGFLFFCFCASIVGISSCIEIVYIIL